MPVDLEGTKPPASALAVTTTGFGPGAVAPKKPVPPPKPVPAVSPLGKAGAKAAKPGKSGGGGAGGAGAAGAGGRAVAAARRRRRSAPLSADKLLQPPVAPTGVRPEDDPAFTQVTGNVKGFAKAKRAHPPAASKAKEAQDAALAPTDDLAGQAKAAKVDTMDAQQAGTFDKKAFIAAVKAAIEAKSPKTLKEADNYKESGKAGEVKGEVKGLVTQGKEGQAKDIETATEAPPDQSKAVAKPVTPMAPEQPGQAVPIPAAGAVPKPAPAEQINLAAGKHAGQPGDGGRRGQRAAAGAVQRARSSSRRSPTSRPRPRTPTPRRAQFRAAGAGRSSSRARRTPPRRPRRASPACRAPRVRRWPSWSPTRARRSRRTRRSAPRSPRRSRASSPPPRPT